MKLQSVILCIWISLHTIYAQNKPTAPYPALLNPGSELLRAGANFSIEKTKDGLIIIKSYYKNRPVIAYAAQYDPKAQTLLHGPYYELSIAGDTIISGMYSENTRVGYWRLGEGRSGNYMDGQLEGEVMTYQDDKVILKELFEDGKRIGKVVSYDATGNIIMEKDAKDYEKELQAKMRIERYSAPLFPGVDYSGLTDDDMVILSDTTMKASILQSLRYPPQARNEGVTGKTSISFTIDADGTLLKAFISQNIHPAITESLYNLIYQMPDWIPGNGGDRSATFNFTLPVTYRLMGN